MPCLQKFLSFTRTSLKKKKNIITHSRASTLTPGSRWATNKQPHYTKQHPSVLCSGTCCTLLHKNPAWLPAGQHDNSRQQATSAQCWQQATTLASQPCPKWQIIALHKSIWIPQKRCPRLQGDVGCVAAWEPSAGAPCIDTLPSFLTWWWCSLLWQPLLRAAGFSEISAYSLKNLD